MPTQRLQTIETRQRRQRTRDIVFAAFVVLAAAMGATAVGSCLDAASPHIAQR